MISKLEEAWKDYELWGKATAASKPDNTCIYCGDAVSHRKTIFNGSDAFCSYECLFGHSEEVSKTETELKNLNKQYNSTLAFLVEYIEKRRWNSVRQYYPKLLHLESKRNKLLQQSPVIQVKKKASKKRELIDNVIKQMLPLSNEPSGLSA